MTNSLGFDYNTSKKGSFMGRPRLFTDEERIARKKEQDRAYAIENKERVREYKKQHMRRVYARDPEAARERARMHTLKRPDLKYGCVLRWRKKNLDKVRMLNRNYAKKKRAATPKWLSKEDKDCMLKFSIEAKRMSAATGQKHVVDHIIPFNGKLVSGLNVPWNMQILTIKDNSRKSNKAG